MGNNSGKKKKDQGEQKTTIHGPSDESNEDGRGKEPQRKGTSFRKRFGLSKRGKKNKAAVVKTTPADEEDLSNQNQHQESSLEDGKCSNVNVHPMGHDGYGDELMVNYLGHGAVPPGPVVSLNQLQEIKLKQTNSPFARSTGMEGGGVKGSVIHSNDSEENAKLGKNKEASKSNRMMQTTTVTGPVDSSRPIPKPRRKNVDTGKNADDIKSRQSAYPDQIVIDQRQHQFNNDNQVYQHIAEKKNKKLNRRKTFNL